MGRARRGNHRKNFAGLCAAEGGAAGKILGVDHDGEGFLGENVLIIAHRADLGPPR